MQKLIRMRFAALAALLALLVMSGGANADGKKKTDDQDAVEDLTVCYARGTDTLGRAVGAAVSAFPEDTVNIGNEKFDAALALYRECFSKDFSFTLEFDLGFGLPPSTTPNVDDGLADTDPALQWANFVNDNFRGAGYRNTQHHMGSISSEIHGKKRAHVVSYLIATHAVQAANGGGASIVGGTYTDEVVKEKGRWVILHRTLLVTSSAFTP